MWKVNAGRRSGLAAEFLNRGVVAIGWREAGNYAGIRSRAEMLARIAAAYPAKTDRQNEVSAAQAWRFVNEVAVGDRVTTYDPVTRLYHLGRIEDEARYVPDDIETLPVTRRVAWQATVRRDDLSPAALGKLSAILTLFKVEATTAAELVARSEGQQPQPEEPSGEVVILDEAPDPYSALEEQALERVKDRLLRLDWAEMQEMVASLLRALGYRTIVSPPGADRGKDIIASPDGFGFEAPRIVVEVKHRRGAMGAPEIRAFLGGRHNEDRGLYVSTGGFTREAQFEAERAATITHLMTLDGLAQALIDNYEKLDERGRLLLPLMKLYWPVD